MIKILHFIDHYRIGGPGKTIINSAKNIDNKVYKILIASFVPKLTGETELSLEVKKNKIPFFEIEDNKGMNWRIIYQLSKILKKNKIQILHTHGYKTDFLGLIIKVVFPNIKLISTHHGWITNSKNALLKKFISLNLTRFFDGVITVSYKLYLELPEKAKKKSKIIHNAIILRDYETSNVRNKIRLEYNVKNNEILLGVIGRLSIEKGSLSFLLEFRKLLNSEKNIKLIFIGEGPQELEMQNLISELNLNGKIILAGYKYPVSPFYNAIDILISPSKTEGLSNTILEAMSFELPVIATNVGGNNEIIYHGINGLLVLENDSKSMIDFIIECVNNKKLRKLLGKNARSTIEKRFMFENRMKKVEKFYSEILF